jgi:hypothetical protein
MSGGVLCSDMLNLPRPGFALPDAARTISYAHNSEILVPGTDIPARPRSAMDGVPAQADVASCSTSQSAQQGSTSVHPSAAAATRVSPAFSPQASAHSSGLARCQQGNGYASQHRQAWATPVHVCAPAAPPSLPDSDTVVRCFLAKRTLLLLLVASFAYYAMLACLTLYTLLQVPAIGAHLQVPGSEQPQETGVQVTSRGVSHGRASSMTVEERQSLLQQLDQTARCAVTERAHLEPSRHGVISAINAWRHTHIHCIGANDA